MTAKRCTDCKHTKGIGYDFWCGEGHTEYEVFAGETNCPYYEYHDWSKGTPSMTAKRFTYEYDEYNGNLFDNKMNTFYHIEDSDENIEVLCDRLNWLVEENEELKHSIKCLEADKMELQQYIKRMQGDVE